MVIHIDSNYPFDGCIESRIGGRSENQDSCGFSDTPLGLLVVVCDGMGGGPAGKTASLIATQTIINVIKVAEVSVDISNLLKDAISDANMAIIDASEETPSLKGMGTTTVVLLLCEDCAYIGHVGDSRLYKLRGREKIFRTNDHSYVGELVRKWQLTEEQARLSAQSNIITRALGTQDTCEPEIDVVAYEKGDRFVLCTDGIWGAFPESMLIKKMSENKSLDFVVDQLSTETDEQGRANGGHHDNLTIAIIETKTDSKKKDSMTRLAKRIILLMAVLLIVCIGCIANLYKNQSQIGKLKSEINVLNESVQERDKKIEELQQDIRKVENDKELADEKVRTAQANARMAQAKAEVADMKAKKAEVERDAARSDKNIGQKSVNTKPNSSSQLNQLTYLLTQLKNLECQNENDIKKNIKNKQTEISKECVKIVKIDHSFETYRTKITKDWSKQYQKDPKTNKYTLTNKAKNEISDLINNIKTMK